LIGSEGLDSEGGPYNTISQNSIHDNGKVGIDLGPHDGATPNGNYNASSFSNSMIDHPVLTSANRYPVGVPGLFVGGTYYSWFDQDITLEFFISPASNNVQGAKYVGSSVFHAAANKSTNFVASFASLAIPAGWVVTATATDQLGNTSEFSQAITPTTNKAFDKLFSQSAASPSVVTHSDSPKATKLTAIAPMLDVNTDEYAKRKSIAVDQALAEVIRQSSAASYLPDDVLDALLSAS
jgi:hypothetical protein